MPLDRYVTLGRSGLRVSPFCMGCMTFGEDWGWGSSAKDSEAILDRFIDAGRGGGIPGHGQCLYEVTLLHGSSRRMPYHRVFQHWG